jgi:2-oxoglutarate ferredoxin oxidoreductase subunit gamma
MRKECRLCGSGGQGIILAGIILAEAAAIHEGKHVVQVQDYGPAARGDSSKTDVIISSKPIIYPKCERLDLLVALSQKAYEENFSFVRRSGITIIDSNNVKPAGKGSVVRFPMTELARERAGGTFSVNMVALGIIAAVADVVRFESIEKAMHERVPQHTREQNQAALLAGFQIAQETRKTKRHVG